MKRRILGVVRPCVDEIGDHVVLRLCLTRAYVRDQITLQVADFRGVLDHLLARLHAPDLLCDSMRPALNFFTVELLEAELLADDAYRHRHGEIIDAICLAFVGQLLDQICDDGGNDGFELLHAMRGEGLIHQLADARVIRRIGHDRVWKETTAVAYQDLLELRREALGVLLRIAFLHRESDGIAQYRLQILVARHEIHAELRVEMHGIVRAHARSRTHWDEQESSDRSASHRSVSSYRDQ